jgi:hypothetical protein
MFLATRILADHARVQQATVMVTARFLANSSAVEGTRIFIITAQVGNGSVKRGGGEAKARQG